MSDRTAATGTVFMRGLRGRCPNCGSRGIFASVFDLHEDCPTCGLHFEREEGYWLGSMVVIMGLVIVVFAVFMVSSLVVYWPDVPWTAIMVVGIVLMVAVPVFGYAWAKSIWLGIDWGLSPPEASEIADAIARRAADDDT